jgi:hypothetical protein
VSLAGRADASPPGLWAAAVTLLAVKGACILTQAVVSRQPICTPTPVPLTPDHDNTSDAISEKTARDFLDGARYAVRMVLVLAGVFYAMEWAPLRPTL